MIVIDTAQITAILLRDSVQTPRGPFDAAMVFLKQRVVQVEPVDAHQVALASAAYRRFGKCR